MSFLNKLLTDNINVVEWPDTTGRAIVYKFLRNEKAIAMGARLVVQKSQQAMLVKWGEVQDVFAPGTYTLTRQTMPMLAEAMSWNPSFNTPFNAEVYFVSTKQFIGLKWGTPKPISISNNDIGFTEIRAFGSFGFQITNPAKFIKALADIKTEFVGEKFMERLRDCVVDCFKKLLTEGNLKLEQIVRENTEIPEGLLLEINQELDSCGMRLNRFIVESVTMPDEVRQKLKPQGHSNYMPPVQEEQNIPQIETTIESEAPGQSMQAETPPPFPKKEKPVLQPKRDVKQYYVAMYEKQYGPYTLYELGEQVRDSEVVRDTLIWRPGLAEWTPAVSISDVAVLFNDMPPPIPPIA